MIIVMECKNFGHININDHILIIFQFEFAFELAKLAMPKKLQSIHYKYAMALEDGGKYEDAEEHFLKAGKPKEAISMYVHAKEWQKAEAVAESHDKGSLPNVLLAQANDVIDRGNPGAIENLLLRAQKPDMLVKYYQENDMWLDALRICKEYLPSKLPTLQNLYDRQVGTKGNKTWYEKHVLVITMVVTYYIHNGLHQAPET